MPPKQSRKSKAPKGATAKTQTEEPKGEPEREQAAKPVEEVAPVKRGRNTPAAKRSDPAVTEKRPDSEANDSRPKPAEAGTGEKKAPKPLVTSNIARFVKRHVYKDVVEAFTETFAPVHLEEVPGKHLHPWSHACRAEAIINLIVMACRKAEELGSESVDILSIYGSDAEHVLVDQINKIMGSRGPLIRLTTYCEFTFQGDAVRHYARSINSRQFKALLEERGNSLFHGVHLVDIYQCGNDPNRALDPDYLRSVAKMAHGEAVHVLLRPFFGEAGCDDPIAGGQEGVWYRDAHRRIIFYPEGDRASIPYAPHPDCNWMFTGRHCRGLALAVTRSYGPYRLVKVVVEADDAIELLTPHEYPTGDFQIFTPKITCLQEHISKSEAAQKVLEKADRTLPTNIRLALKAMKEVTAHAETVKSLVGSNELILNGFSMRGLRDKVVRAFERDPKVCALRKTLPCEIYRGLVEGTILAATYHGRKEFAELLLGARLADNETQEAFVKAFAASPGSTCFLTKTQVLLGVSGVVLVAVTGSWLYVFAHGAVKSSLHLTMLAHGKYAHKAHSLRSLAVAGTVGAALVWRKGKRAVSEKFSSSRKHYDEYCEVLASGGEEAPCVKTYIEHLVSCRPFAVPLKIDDLLPCAAVPRNAIAHPHGRMEVEYDGLPVTFEEAVQLVDCEPKGEFTPTLAFACGLAPPSNTSGTALHAMAARALPDLPVTDYVAVSKHAARARAVLLDHLLPLGGGELLTLDECADLMPNRQADRFRRTVAEISAGRIDEFSYTKKKTMLKLNETIKVAPVKARLLDCLEPAHTVVTMQGARGTLTALKRTFSVERGFVNVGDWTLHIIICSGGSPAYMDEVGEAIRMATFPTIVVAGDDCTIYWGAWEGVVHAAATEVDGEKFDITQSIELLKETANVFRAALRDCDVAEKVFQYFLDVATKPLVWRDRKRFCIKAFPRSRAPTGTTFTTAMNCVATLFWVIHHFSRVGPQRCNSEALLDVGTSGRELGFKLTVEHHLDVKQAIFLKGCFLPDVDGYFRFCTLPSQVLKLGKTIQRPTVSQRERDPVKALAMVAGAMGRSMPTVRDDVPILGPFLAVLRRHGDVDEKGLLEELNDNPYKVVGSNGVPRETYLDFVCERYDTTVEDVEELEGMLAAVNALPILISHPLVSKLALRDYY